MKFDRTYLFITISSVALVIVLIIQVSWIYHTAKIKEELFNERAILVLSKTAEALNADQDTRRRLQFSVGSNEVHKIDSLFNHYMKEYNIHIDYFFEVKPVSMPSVISGKPENSLYTKQEPGCYTTCLEKLPPGKQGSELKLVFPELEQFIIEEMGTLFITSVALILVVLVMSWRNILSLIKEKKISEHTTDFLNNMTHEFKTPLTNIALAGKMILKDTNIKQEEKIKHYSGIILEENEKLRLQVEQMLSMTALERGEIPLRKTEIDFHQLVHDCLKCISVQIETQQGHLSLDLTAKEFVVMGDKTHLTNAVCNLIDNAIKYSKEQPEIAIKTYNAESNLAFVITDKGIGIDDEYHKKVFDKFFRVPTGDVHNVKGFGLGLTYIKSIFELHGGSIALKSTPGEGTTFTVILPYV